MSEIIKHVVKHLVSLVGKEKQEIVSQTYFSEAKLVSAPSCLTLSVFQQNRGKIHLMNKPMGHRTKPTFQHQPLHLFYKYSSIF